MDSLELEEEDTETFFLRSLKYTPADGVKGTGRVNPTDHRDEMLCLDGAVDVGANLMMKHYLCCCYHSGGKPFCPFRGLIVGLMSSK